MRVSKEMTLRLLVFAFVSIATYGEAAVGDPDPTFGTGGVVVDGGGAGWGVVLEDGGRLVTSALSGTVRRHLPDGALDAMFGSGGRRDVTETGQVFDVAVRPDGRLLVIGTPPNSSVAWLVQLAADGDLDTSFTPWEDHDQTLHAVEVQPGGRVLVLRRVRRSGPQALSVLGFLPDGTLDPSFADGGVLDVGLSSIAEADTMLVRPDGRFVVTTFDGESFVRAFEADGDPDPSFVSIAVPGSIRDPVLLGDGTITYRVGRDVVRLRADGMLDPTFGIGGIAAVPNPSESWGSLVDLGILPTGRVAVGLFRGLVVLAADGTLDVSLGVNGFVPYPPGPDGELRPRSLVVQDDGRLVIAGESYPALAKGKERYALFRLLGDCGDGLVAGAEECDDGNAVGGDCCSSGCRFEPSGSQCDVDGDLCTTDVCDGAGACSHVDDGPQDGCKSVLAPRRSSLTIADAADDGRDAVTWRWGTGAATTRTDLGLPTEIAGYAFCVYDESGAEPSTLVSATVEPGGTCANRPCWKAVGREPPGSRGYKFNDKTRAQGGVYSLVLKPGPDERAEISVQLKGVNVRMPAEGGGPGLPLASPVAVRAQLKASTGVCWEGVFTSALLNDALRFKALSE
jgi:uncharacterized delta-60 repeat protein